MRSQAPPSIVRLLGVECGLLFAAYSFAQTPSLKLEVDATDAPRKVLHARLNIPAKPGKLTLVYPKWIPGEHGPTGPITDVVALKFGANLDVVPGSPADKAGIGPAMKLIAGNGQRWTSTILREAVKAAKEGRAAVELLVENADYFKTCKVEYRDGEKYPHLERDDSKPDLLAQILKPLTPAPASKD